MHSERNWLHGFCRGLFPPSKLKIFQYYCNSMEKKVENVKQTPESAKPPLEKREIQSKPKTGKIVRIVPIGVPFSPKQFKEIHELSLRGPSNKTSKS